MTTTKDNKKSKIKVTEKDRKKYGVCEHNQVNYKALEELNKVIYNELLVAEKAFKNKLPKSERKKFNDALIKQKNKKEKQ